MFPLALDLPTLSLAVVLVMLLSSLSLAAHWFANRATSGLGQIAAGVLAFSVGNCIIFEFGDLNSDAMVLTGHSLILIGHMWIWLGISDFWQIRRRRLVILVGGVTLLALMSAGYQYYVGASLVATTTSLSLFIAALSLGIVRTLVQAPGGHLGFYRGIVRRTTIGVALAAGLFIVHAAYNLYHAYMAGDIPVDASLQLSVFARLEALTFVMLLALVVIIMTAERFQAELKIQEMMDPLTRALNRRAFLEVLKAVLARARRLAEPVSLIMVDIDKFKKINLKHGRTTGDRALAEFAAALMKGRRNQDVFCRYGGEEFVLMLPGTPEEGADLVAGRIKEQIEKTSIRSDGGLIKLTISLGLVTARGEDLDAEGMLDVVDRRMLRAQKLRFETIETAS